MKYIVCTLALFLTACSSRLNEMSIEDYKTRKQYCIKNGAKDIVVVYNERTRGVLDVRCVLDGYETPSTTKR